MSYQAGFLDSHRPDSFLIEEVRHAMAGRPRALPQAMALDAVGYALYARVTDLSHDGERRSEEMLIRSFAWEIAARAGTPSEVVDLQAGLWSRSQALLSGVERYVAVASSRPVLDQALGGIEASFPALEVRAIVGDAAFGVAATRRPFRSRLVLLLDSYLGRFDPTMARIELAQLRGHLEPEDRLLVGMNLTQPDDRCRETHDGPDDVYPAYAFNALHRANREVGTDFRSMDWRLVVEPLPEHGRIETRLEARRAVLVSGGKVGGSWDFLPGDPLILDQSYRPTEGQVAAIALGAGFQLVETWKDRAGGYGLFMLAP